MYENQAGNLTRNISINMEKCNVIYINSDSILKNGNLKKHILNSVINLLSFNF